MKSHHYQITTNWTGNTGRGTQSYRGYERDHTISIPGKSPLNCSSDPSFMGDPNKHNPEELLLSAVSGCHMLWYLHLCSSAGIVVVDYQDIASATMEEDETGSGRFTSIELHIRVRIDNPEQSDRAKALHEKANSMCFIANSLNIPVSHKVQIV